MVVYHIKWNYPFCTRIFGSHPLIVQKYFASKTNTFAKFSTLYHCTLNTQVWTVCKENKSNIQYLQIYKHSGIINNKKQNYTDDGKCAMIK